MKSSIFSEVLSLSLLDCKIQKHTWMLLWKYSPSLPVHSPEGTGISGTLKWCYNEDCEHIWPTLRLQFLPTERSASHF